VSVRRNAPSGISVTLLSGPLAYPHEVGSMGAYHQVNDYHIDNHYEEKPAWLKVLTELNAICRGGMSEGRDDSDYGYIPGHYISLSIGDWDRPYTQKINGEIVESASDVADETLPSVCALDVISARPATQVAEEAPTLCVFLDDPKLQKEMARAKTLRLVPAPKTAQAEMLELMGL